MLQTVLSQVRLLLTVSDLDEHYFNLSHDILSECYNAMQ